GQPQHDFQLSLGLIEVQRLVGDVGFYLLNDGRSGPPGLGVGLELQDPVTDLDLIAVAQGLFGREALPIQKGTIDAPQVPEEVSAVTEGDLGMPPANRLGGQTDGDLRYATDDGVPLVERELLARLGALKNDERGHGGIVGAIFAGCTTRFAETVLR